MTKPDLDFLDALADAAARETLPRFRAGTAVANKRAGGFDPVTEADRAAETAIRQMIGAHFPGHGILGEEHGEKHVDSRFLWVIDPIDGTRSYISGVPLWGTLIGLYEDGRAVLGLMDQPFTRERYKAGPPGAFYSGPEGERGLAVRDCAGLGEATLFTTSPFLFSEERRHRYAALESRVKLARYGADCYAFALLAGGHVDMVIEGGLEPYDIAGLVAIIEKAGGLVTTWTGERPERGGDIVACASAALHAEALEWLGG